MKVVGGDRAANLDHAGEMIAEAAQNGAQFVLLPEAMDLGWTDPSALTEAEAIPEGKTCRILSEMAIKYNLYICSGLIEKDGDKVFNSAVIIDPKGEVILLHRKINELDIGHPYYALGDRLNVCQHRVWHPGPLNLCRCQYGRICPYPIPCLYGSRCNPLSQ